MKGRTISYVIACCMIWLETALSATAQPVIQHCDSPGLQNFAKGDNGLAVITNFGLTLFGQNPDQVSQAAAADGIPLLAKLIEQNGYDWQRAWMIFVQSSEGQRIMCVPGARSLLIDWVNSVMALSSGPQKPVNPGRADLQRKDKSAMRPADQSGGEIAGTLTPPFLGPYRPDAYGQGINSDATGRPFVWRPDQGPADPFAKVRPDVLGPGIGMDQYGRPVRAACPPFQQAC
jgi:hypothetical protein